MSWSCAVHWQWYASGMNAGEKPYMNFRFKPDGSIATDLLRAWELLPTGEIRVYLRDGNFWSFTLDPDTKTARSNLKQSRIKGNKAFTAIP